MSKFLSQKFENLAPYVPGEQPQDMQYVKLNTNECPFPPSSYVADAVASFEANKLRLYPDPENAALCNSLAKYYGVESENVFVGNGSDEVLAFIFMGFFDKEKEVCYPDVSYGFYPVFCDLYGLKKNEIALKDDFSINVNAFIASDKAIVIANPNAPTGIALSAFDIEKIVKSNPNSLVVVDEAYIDFGGESVVKLVKTYRNLIVVQTLSKSRALAGARLGVAIADAELIKDIKAMKFSFNSYNVNRLTESVAIAAVEDNDYFENCRKEIIKNREWTTGELKSLGFEVLPSCANFVFAKHNTVGGETVYKELKRRGILVRHFSKAKISDFVRITIGSAEQMQKLILEIKNLLSNVK